MFCHRGSNMRSLFPSQQRFWCPFGFLVSRAVAFASGETATSISAYQSQCQGMGVRPDGHLYDIFWSSNSAMNDANQYRRLAEECRRQAEQVADSREAWLRLARGWSDLAATAIAGQPSKD
jgi:hypothetical protein